MIGERQDLTRSHWYWRPGWRVGRKHFTWHVTFTDSDAHALAPVVDRYQPVIDGLTHLEPLPFSWLHLTTQGVGFTDEVDPGDLRAIIDCVTKRLSVIPPVAATFGPADTDAEGLFLTVHPDSELQNLRSHIRAGIADVWGSELVPESAKSFTPHVTLAYSDAVVSLHAAREVLKRVTPEVAALLITHVALIELNRDNRRYEWSEIARVQLGSAQPE